MLPELVTEGETVSEALAHVEDAVAALVEAYEELGRPLPDVLQRMALRVGSRAGLMAFTLRKAQAALRRGRWGQGPMTSLPQALSSWSANSACWR